MVDRFAKFTSFLLSISNLLNTVTCSDRLESKGMMGTFHRTISGFFTGLIHNSDG